MEKLSLTDWEMKNLVRELSEGREQARQLQIQLNAQSCSYETREFLIHRIISSYDQALSMLQLQNNHPLPLPPPPVDSPQSGDDSEQENQGGSKKRKGAPRWTQRVKVSPETGIEGQLDDGYGWRKYGQKDILGAKHPRGYYRCTNRHGQGCLATKQVQKSDEDPTVFVITYRREHTCYPRATPTAPHSNDDPNPLPDNPVPLNQDPFLDIQTSFRIIKQDPFDFASPSSSLRHINNPQGDDDGHSNNTSNIFGNNCFPLDNDFGGLIPNLMHTSESELSTIVAAMTSGTSTTAVGTSFSSAGLDSNFSFGDHGYYP